MNFFQQQDRARRSTTLLVIFFVLAVACIVGAVNLLVFGVLSCTRPEVQQGASVTHYFTHYGDIDEYGRPRDRSPVGPTLVSPTQVHIGVTVITLLIIAGGSIYKIGTLSRGGAAVAELLDGQPLSGAPTEVAEQTLRNVVEEMAIASGVPVPGIYVLPHEDGINAFAAGFTPKDAVIGVTRGCITKLNRDELQGVIAHEFSHILNGDMRLNLRLTGILHGILVIGLIGYGILRVIGNVGTRSSSRGSKRGGGLVVILLVLVVGVSLVAIGYIGVFFGRLIQAAVSRQREYLADASAVQFTRNPAGLVGALKKLGAYSSASRIDNVHALEFSHMFFGNAGGFGLTNLLASHPPLIDRIRAIDPSFDGTFSRVTDGPTLIDRYGERRPVDIAALVTGYGAPSSAGAASALLDATDVTSRVGAPIPRHVAYAAGLLDAVPPALASAAREPFGARAVIFCLLLSDKDDVRQVQLDMLRQHVDPTTYRETTGLIASVGQLGPASRLPLIDVALPALRQLSGPQVVEFKQLVRGLITADKRVSLFEFALLKTVERSLLAPDEPARRATVKYVALQPVMDDARTLLAALSCADGKASADCAAAYVAGARQLDDSKPRETAAAPSLKQVSDALDRLVAASPAVKRRVIDACAYCVAADGEFQIEEAELLRAVTSSLDCPLPPFLAAE